jgi:ankyrin repeat protein
MSSCKYDLSLLELIWRQRWSSVERRVKAHPHELNFEHKGLLALHWACCNDPPASTLRVMLQQNVRYALMRDENGQTPLILLLSVSSNDDMLNAVASVNAFCQVAPESVSIQDYYSRSPLHYLCTRGMEHNQQRSNLEIIGLLLRVDPNLALCMNSDGETALDQMFMSSSADEGAFLWDMVQLMLSAACPETDGGCLLHQLVSYPECRYLMVDYAIGWSSEWLASTDRLGNTVLHRAVLKGCKASIIRVLVRCQPNLVCQRNQQGLLPIQLASHWSGNALEILLQHYPQTVECCVGLTSDGYYAPVLANARAPQTIFALLRNKPSLIESSS